MAPSEPVQQSECDALSFCFGRGFCRRHVRTQDIFCECLPQWSGSDCSIFTEPTTQSPTKGFVSGVSLWLWIIGLVLLFIASVICVIYAALKCKRYPSSSVVDLRADRENERDAALNLLNPEEQQQKVRITVEVCD